MKSKHSLLIGKCAPYALLAALVLFVFGAVATFGYVYYDDGLYVIENPVMQDGINSRTLHWAFTNTYKGNYHPLTWVSLMVDAAISFGLAHTRTGILFLDPRVFHVTNLLLHLACVLLLYSLLAKMTGSTWRSAFVAALFAVHPLHAESVAWIVERKDVLSTLFWLLAMLAYVNWVGKRTNRRYALVAGLMVAGLMSKSMLVSLPVVLLLIDIWPLKRIDLARESLRSKLPALLKEKGVLFAISAAYCVVTFWAQRVGGAVGTLERYPLGERISNAVVSYATYLVKMVWPANLSVCYRYIHAIPPHKIALSALLIIASTVFAVRCVRKRPYVTVGWFWYLITMLPVIGFVQIGYQAMADRYTYVPLVGIFIIIAWGLRDLLTWGREDSAFTRRAGAAIGIVVIVLLAVGCRAQVRYWRDGIALFKHAAAVDDQDPVVYCSLGVALDKSGRTNEAIAQYRRALKLRPEYTIARSNLAVLLMNEGDFKGSEKEFKTALRFKPDSPRVYLKLGILMMRQGRLDDAKDHFRSALLLEPQSEEARAYIMEIDSLKMRLPRGARLRPVPR